MSVMLLTEHHLEFLSLKGGYTLSKCHIVGNHNHVAAQYDIDNGAFTEIGYLMIAIEITVANYHARYLCVLIHI